MVCTVHLSVVTSARYRLLWSYIITGQHSTRGSSLVYSSPPSVCILHPYDFASNNHTSAVSSTSSSSSASWRPKAAVPESSRSVSIPLTESLECDIAGSRNCSVIVFDGCEMLGPSFTFRRLSRKCEMRICWRLSDNVYGQNVHTMLY